MAKAKKDGESVAVLYQNTVISIEDNATTYVFNSIGKDGIYVENDSEKSYELYDMFGTKYASGTLTQGVNKLPLNNCGMAVIK